MKKIGLLVVIVVVLALVGCALFGGGGATYCDSIDSCTGCALTEEGTCNDGGRLSCSGSAGRCANECLHTSGAAQCGHPGCACSVSCGCR